MNYISVDPGDRLCRLFDIDHNSQQFDWIFISEYRLTRIINGVDEFDSAILERLTADRSTRLIVSSILEIISADYAPKARALFEKLNIDLTQVHFVVVTEPQRQMILDWVPEFSVSVFNYWEHLTPTIVNKWQHKKILPLEKKKFLYLNRRCSPDRAYIFYQLWNNMEFRSETHASMHRGAYWDKTVNVGEHFQQCMSGLAHIKKFKKIEKFYQRTQLPQLNRYGNPWNYDFFGDRDNELASYYKNTNVSIIVESHPHHPQSAFMPTEKLYRSLAAGQPFVVFGVQNYYRNLQAQGYRFAEIPAYDSEEDLFVRADLFAKYVLDYSKRWDTIADKQQSYAEYNQQVLKKRIEKFAKNFHPELQPFLKPSPGRF